MDVVASNVFMGWLTSNAFEGLLALNAVFY
jgi:hypothetical protein